MKPGFILCLALSGCATDYRGTPTMQLCLDYLTAPSHSVWQAGRAQELSNRGENCAGYGAAAAARNEANRQSDEALQRALRPPPNQVKQGTHTYIINGRTVNCTTSGTYTSCY